MRLLAKRRVSSLSFSLFSQPLFTFIYTQFFIAVRFGGYV
jgi:hypothetical protein